MNQFLQKNVLTIVMASSIVGLPQTQSAQMESVVKGNTAFALDLYGQLKSTPGNLFFSPYSISTALAMTYAGAKGNTEKQMAQVLHFSGNQPELHSEFGVLQRQISDAGKQAGIEINIANALWAQKGHPFLPAFLNVAKDEYLANVSQVDFKTAAEPARSEINRWVAQKTKDKIQDILPPGSLDSVTRLVLANAIYFKGIWVKQFAKAKTSDQPFHVSLTRQVSVPLMNNEDNVSYMEDPDFQAVELPYKSDALSMVIFLPRRIDGCESFENRLSAELLSGSLRQMKHQKVKIFLPRFKLESSFNLSGTLTKMGMKDTFSNANFSGMDGTTDLFISAVFHKAWGEVNEEGTEAAAATAVVVSRSMAINPNPPPVFRADHPFIFFIRDTRSGSLLFLGRLANPAP